MLRPRHIWCPSPPAYLRRIRTDAHVARRERQLLSKAGSQLLVGQRGADVAFSAGLHSGDACRQGQGEGRWVSGRRAKSEGELAPTLLSASAIETLVAANPGAPSMDWSEHSGWPPSWAAACSLLAGEGSEEAVRAALRSSSGVANDDDWLVPLRLLPVLPVLAGVHCWVYSREV